jgi:hypothetical protein
MPKLHRLHVLISHAHADVGVVTALAKLLINSGLPQEDIYCTSLPSHGVHVGVDFERDIRSKIRSANVIIALLSERYYSSATACSTSGLHGFPPSARVCFPTLLTACSHIVHRHFSIQFGLRNWTHNGPRHFNWTHAERAGVRLTIPSLHSNTNKYFERSLQISNLVLPCFTTIPSTKSVFRRVLGVPCSVNVAFRGTRR